MSGSPWERDLSRRVQQLEAALKATADHRGRVEAERNDAIRERDAAIARAEKAERSAERRKRHIELLLARLRNAGERIRRVERALPHWANVPGLETLLRQRDQAWAALSAYEDAFDACGAGSGFDEVQLALERKWDQLRQEALAEARRSKASASSSGPTPA